jgi:prepilin-type N-terminal cleavage/methylation domain-containing protein
MLLKTNRKASGFTLVELLVVVAILGALTSLILPHMVSSEEEAKDTACDYNNYGSFRYVSMYNSVNGAYPSAMDTGLNAAGDNFVGMYPLFTAYNLANTDATTLSTLTAGEAASLEAAGIHTITSDAGQTSIEEVVAAGLEVFKITSSATDNWTEEIVYTGATELDLSDIGAVQAAITAGDFDTSGAGDVTINGSNFRDYTDANTVVIPLWIGTNTNWEQYWDGGEYQESKVGMAIPGRCPWLGEEYRFYICFYQVDTTGTNPAKLIGTTCPECGSLNP